MNITYLSFSRLRELAHSPRNLKKYLTEEKVPTKAMQEGNLLDVILFTPQKFDSLFYVMPDDVKKPSVSQLNAAKPSPASISQIQRWNEIEREIGERTVITASQLEEAKRLAQEVQNNSTVVFHGLLRESSFSFQQEFSFFYKGFLHKGVLDAKGQDRQGNLVIWDLKRMGSASGELLVRKKIRDMLYDLQAAIYCYPFDEKDVPVKYYIIAVDNDGFVTPFEIGREARDKSRYLWDKLVNAAHMLNMEEDLSMGPEFWADRNGFFQY